MDRRPLIFVAVLAAPLCGGAAHARGADDLDVTIRMIDRRDPNVDRFMNRIQLPAGLPDSTANRSDQRSSPSGDNSHKDGSDDNASPAANPPDRRFNPSGDDNSRKDGSDDSAGTAADRPGRSDDGLRPNQADIPRPSRESSDDPRENRRDNADKSRRRD